jgi:anti-sigma factor RsiW
MLSMDCDRVQHENIIERYLIGKLTPEEKEAWEVHYFDCPACAEALETMQSIQGALREAEPEIRGTIQPRRHIRIWAGAGIAAAVVVALAIGFVRRPAVVPPRYAAVLRVLPALASVEPAAYEETPTRGIPTHAETLFRDAMRVYKNREWMAASEGLRASLREDATAPAPRFFLGVSLLLAGRITEGVRELEAVASGGSPFAEEARFDLAKGYLLMGRNQDALAALATIAGRSGDFAARASALQVELGRMQQ